MLFLAAVGSVLRFVFLPTCEHTNLHHLQMVLSLLYLKPEPFFSLLHYVFVLCEIIGLMDQILPKLHRDSS